MIRHGTVRYCYGPCRHGTCNGLGLGLNFSARGLSTAQARGGPRHGPYSVRPKPEFGPYSARPKPAKRPTKKPVSFGPVGLFAGFEVRHVMGLPFGPSRASRLARDGPNGRPVTSQTGGPSCAARWAREGPNGKIHKFNPKILYKYPLIPP